MLNILKIPNDICFLKKNITPTIKATIIAITITLYILPFLPLLYELIFVPPYVAHNKKPLKNNYMHGIADNNPNTSHIKKL